ncbi:MAG TPA: type 4a pilus biogenesis protein PilO [Ignavibacteriaceae bacterium]|nr:type 4a pilus biogenesis protein PilO [Ignavibacteriaceae bacterium]
MMRNSNIIFSSKKWKNYFILYLLFFLFVLIVELLPRSWEFFNNVYTYYDIQDLDKEKQVLLSKNKLLKKENSYLNQSIINSVKYNKETNLSSIISIIDDYSNRSGASIISIIPENLFEKENLRIQPIGIELSSDYEGLYNFIRYLEISQKVFSIKSINITPVPNPDSLNIKLKLWSYLNI